MNELKEKERQSLLKDLEFFTRYYKFSQGIIKKCPQEVSK
jgi:hypothetical protein